MSALELRSYRRRIEEATTAIPTTETESYRIPLAMLAYGEQRRILLRQRGYAVETGSLSGGRGSVYRWDDAGERAERLLNIEVEREERELAASSERRKAQARAELPAADNVPTQAPAKRKPGAPWVFGG